MTAIQICALIGLIVGAALIYWTGYRGGLIDGRVEGIEEGTNDERAANAKTIRELEASSYSSAPITKPRSPCEAVEGKPSLRPSRAPNAYADRRETEVGL